jgi:Leucine-rich repeat (LRR) protein
LKELNLEKNKLTILPDSLFCDNYRLLDLNLASNYLEKITWDQLNGLSSLLILRLNGNLLTYLKNDTLWELKRLATFDANHNILGELPAGLFANSPGIRTM